MRYGLEPRIDDDRHALTDGRGCLEEAEWVTGPDVKGLDPEVAAPRERHAAIRTELERLDAQFASFSFTQAGVRARRGDDTWAPSA